MSLIIDKATIKDIFDGLCCKGRDGYCFMCIFVDSGKTYEPVIYYQEDRNRYTKPEYRKKGYAKKLMTNNMKIVLQ